MASISIEQPPSTIEPELQHYLERALTEIDIALKQAQSHTVIYVPPAKPRVGRTYYFGAAVPAHPVITAEGLYIYKSTGWTLIV